MDWHSKQKMDLVSGNVLTIMVQYKPEKQSIVENHRDRLELDIGILV